MASRIYINPEDDINTVIDKVAEQEENEVALVVPSGAHILQNIVDAYLLRDATTTGEKSVTIVTNDVMGRVFAERAGITVENPQPGEGDFFISEASAKMADIVPQKKKSSSKKSSKPTTKKKKKGSSSKKETAKKVKKSDKKEAKFIRSYRESRAKSNGFNEIKNRRKNNKDKNFNKFFKLSTPKMLIGVLVIAFLLAGFVFGKVLPKADILIHPVRQTASFNVEILVDKEAVGVDIEKGVIPGEVFTAEKNATQEFSSTGLEDVKRKARGKIVIFNNYSSSPQIFIPSRFQSDDGKIFWTTKNIKVPGAVVEGGQTTPGSVEIEVIADEAGEEYNIKPTNFRMPALKGTERYDGIYAVSESSMEGGLTGQAVVVSEEDLNNAFETLKIKIAPDLKKFKEGLPDGLVLWDETYNEEVAEKIADREVGEPAENFTASVKMVARAVTFKEEHLEKLLNEEINSRLSEDQIIMPKSKEITFLKPPVVDYQRGNISVTLHIKVDVIKNIDTSAFRGAILKKNKEEIKQILPSFKGIERVEIKFWPFWVKSVPKNSDRVNVQIFGM